jgi:hypothetical protein
MARRRLQQTDWVTVAVLAIAFAGTTAYAYHLPLSRLFSSSKGIITSPLKRTSRNSALTSLPSGATRCSLTSEHDNHAFLAQSNVPQSNVQGSSEMQRAVSVGVAQGVVPWSGFLPGKERFSRSHVSLKSKAHDAQEMDVGGRSESMSNITDAMQSNTKRYTAEILGFGKLLLTNIVSSTTQQVCICLMILLQPAHLHV